MPSSCTVIPSNFSSRNISCWCGAFTLLHSFRPRMPVFAVDRTRSHLMYSLIHPQNMPTHSDRADSNGKCLELLATWHVNVTSVVYFEDFSVTFQTSSNRKMLRRQFKGKTFYLSDIPEASGFCLHSVVFMMCLQQLPVYGPCSFPQEETFRLAIVIHSVKCDLLWMQCCFDQPEWFTALYFTSSTETGKNISVLKMQHILY